MEEREIHLRDYLQILYKRRYTALTFFIIAWAVVIIGTLSTTPVYKATTKILIEKAEPYNLTMMYPYYSPYDPEFYETQYQLIKSKAVAQKVVTMLSLETTYASYFKGGEKLLSSSGSKAAEMLSDIVSGGIVVTPVKNSKIIDVSYLSTNPDFATRIVNSVARAYIEEILDMRMSASRYSIEWMTKKAEEEKTKLEKSERALQEYMKSHDIVTLQDKVAITPEKLTEFNAQLIRAETKRKEVESLYNQVVGVTKNLREAETLPAIASEPTVQSLRGQILKAEQNIEELTKKYGKKHPAMIKAEEELRVLRQKREQEIRRVINSIKNEYDLAKANESSLRITLANTKAEAQNLSEKFIDYGVLTREVETNRQLFDALIKRIKEQSVTEEIKSVNVWVVEKAEKPLSPVTPRKALNMFLGVIIGLFGGIGLAFFFEYLDNTIKTPEDVENRLGLPILGTVPLHEKKDSSIEETVLKEPQTLTAETYKTIRTAILLSSASRPPKNILITSMGPEEGKTVTAVNLSVTIARSGYSVLLVDSDMRRPRIHKVFKLNNQSGLSTYLAGTTSDITTLLKSPVANLSVISSGPVPPNPSELLGSHRMKELLQILSERFDMIIWDSPPFMTVTDGIILSRLLEGTIMVVRAGKTTYNVAMRGLRSLRGKRADDIGSRLLGVIMNGFDIRNAEDYYYKYYNIYSSSQKAGEVKK